MYPYRFFFFSTPKRFDERSFFFFVTDFPGACLKHTNSLSKKRHFLSLSIGVFFSALWSFLCWCCFFGLPLFSSAGKLLNSTLWDSSALRRKQQKTRSLWWNSTCKGWWISCWILDRRAFDKDKITLFSQRFCKRGKIYYISLIMFVLVFS